MGRTLAGARGVCGNDVNEIVLAGTVRRDPKSLSPMVLPPVAEEIFRDGFISGRISPLFENYFFEAVSHGTMRDRTP